MKHFIPYLSLFFLFVILNSCQSETIEELDDTSSNLTTEIQNNQNKTDSQHTPIRVNNNKSSDVIIFERSMAWASYITGNLLYNGDFRVEIDSLISANNTIPLENLIGDNSILPAFDTAFQDLLLFFIENESSLSVKCPEDNEIDPGRPIVVVIGGGGGYTENKVAFFINYLTNENCVELYFPTGLDFSTDNTVTTLSHPLNSNNTNEGIRRSISGPCNTTEAVMVSPNYIVTGNDNVIVARPVRDGYLCLYTEYVVDFEEFLSGPF